MAMKVNFELDRVIGEINTAKAKFVCLHLPEGLKPEACTLQQEIETKTNAQVIVWLGTAYGACDIPLHLDRLGIDMIIQFGHAEWKA